MASFAPIRGTRAQIQATPIVDGQFLIETDQGVDNMIYIDEGSTRTIVGGNTVSGVLPELYIYSETGSVVTVEDEGGNVIPTSQVGTDHWTCELPDYGVYTITSVLSGETTTQSIDVNDCMIYTIDASHFHVNIVVTYPSGVGASCQISGGGETYSAPALNPPNTSYKFVVHGKNTTYTITTTVDGATKTATVTSGTTIDQTYEVTMSYGQINLTVETPPITGDITCTDGVTTIIKPASANMVFYVPNTGTWDISGSDGSITYSTSAIVTSLSTPVSAGLNTGLDLALWITAGSTTEYPLNPSSYADFSALEADEAAIRQLMLVHDSVDYLATAPAGDNLMRNVINSGVCAKWINLSDYALDTLGANSDIADEMATTDKYGYGELIEVGSVPAMTDDTVPSGLAFASSVLSSPQYSAYHVFDRIYEGGANTSWSASQNSTTNQYIGYKFTTAKCIKKVMICNYMDDTTRNIKQFKIQWSNDTTNGTDGQWTDLTETLTNGTSQKYNYYTIDNANNYLAYRVFIIDNWGSAYLQTNEIQFFTGTVEDYAPLGNVPIMTANNAPYGTVLSSGDNSSTTAGFTAFDGDSTTGWQPNDASYGAGQGYVGYSFTNPVCVKRVFYDVQPAKTGTGVFTVALEATNDISGTWTELKLLTFNVITDTDRFTDYADLDDNETFYLHYRWRRVAVPAVTRGQVYTLQFYGRELKPLVPTMTDNTTPYGEASADPNNSLAFHAFDGEPSSTNKYVATGQSTAWLKYHFDKPVQIKMLGWMSEVTYRFASITFKGFDGTDWTTFDTVTPPNDAVFHYISVADDTFYEDLQLDCQVMNQAGAAGYNSQLRQVVAYGFDYSEKEFATGSTAKWIYDHGLELVSLTAAQSSGIADKESDQLHIKVTTSNSYARIYTTSPITFPSGVYKYLRAIVGNKMLRTNGVDYPYMYVDPSTYGSLAGIAPTISQIQSDPYNAYSLSVDSIVGDMHIGVDSQVGSTALTREASYVEIWLE